MRSLQEAMKILKNEEKLKIIEESQNSGLKLLRDLVRQSRKNGSSTLEGGRVVVVTTSARNPYDNFVVSENSRSYWESRYKLGLSTGKLHLDNIKDEGVKNMISKVSDMLYDNMTNILNILGGSYE